MVHYKTLIFLLLFLFNNFVTAAELMNVTPDQLVSLQANNALIIDIRTEKEWNTTGVIPGSHKIEFFNNDGDYDLNLWMKRFNEQLQSPDQPVILVCRSGNRTETVGSFLAQKLDMKNIYHLERGIKSWIKSGKKTDKSCPDQLACNKQ